MDNLETFAKNFLRVNNPYYVPRAYRELSTDHIICYWTGLTQLRYPELDKLENKILIQGQCKKLGV